MVSCFDKMVYSARDTVFKTACLRLSIFGLDSESGSSNIHFQDLLDTREREAEVSLETQDAIRTRHLFFGRPSFDLLADTVRELHVDLDDAGRFSATHPFANHLRSDLVRYLNSSVVQVQAMSGVLFLRAVLESFALEFGGAALLAQSAEAGAFSSYSEAARDQLFASLFRGQQFSDRDVFDQLIKLDTDSRFMFPRRSLSKLREIRNKIAHESQSLHSDSASILAGLEELRQYIDDAQKTVAMLFEARVIRAYFKP